MFTICVNIQRLCILPILWLHTCHKTVAIQSCYCGGSPVAVAYRDMGYCDSGAICGNTRKQNGRHDCGTAITCDLRRKDPPPPNGLFAEIQQNHKERYNFTKKKEKCKRTNWHLRRAPQAQSAVSVLLFFRNSFEKAQRLCISPLKHDSWCA